MKYYSFVLASILSLGVVTDAYSQKQINCDNVQAPPVVDGSKADSAWSQTSSTTTRDVIAHIDISLSCVYTVDEIFFMVSFPDETENRLHKTYYWDENEKKYKTGPEREDTFVFKWNMEPIPVDLTLSGDDSYLADIWFWKAVRTDPKGYADDKHQTYSSESIPNATNLFSQTGRQMHLKRKGDSGDSAYEVETYVDYVKDHMPKYSSKNPGGSRADIRAKGVWKDGRWTIEFSRSLVTGHGDDIEFDTAGAYQFGVSRYEIAGRPLDPKLQIPEYGSGEIGEDLELIFVSD